MEGSNTMITLAEKIYNRAEALLLGLVPRRNVGPVFKWVFKLPILQYRLGMGWMIGRHILLLSTTGRRSGKMRQTPLEYEYDEGTGRYRIAAGWGGRTDWCRNIQADPHVMVQVGRRAFQAVAEPAPEEEVAGYMQRVSARHPQMNRVWSRWSDRPVDGTWESCLHAARFFPSYWLRPVE